VTEDELLDLLRHPESTWLDWKQAFPNGLAGGKKDPNWDLARGTILKDLISIANGDDNHEIGYLAYGVEDLDTHRNVIGVSATYDDAMFQNWVENTFEPPPSFTYATVQHTNGPVGIFTIQRTPNYPHVCVTSIGGVLFDGQVWFRRGTKNTVAHYDDLRRMVRGHEPFRFAILHDQQLKAIEEQVRAEGMQPAYPLLIEKDRCLVDGYEVVYYPGTRREIWVGGHNQECILMKRKPPKP
jgi:hypothetical protein